MIMRRVVILGSTGSIGTTCLNYLRKNNPGFIVVGLTAHKNVEKLTLLGKEFVLLLLLIQLRILDLKSFLRPHTQILYSTPLQVQTDFLQPLQLSTLVSISHYQTKSL